MGTDPILTEVPLMVPAGLIICLFALTVTAWPVLAGERSSVLRQRQARWGSWTCLAGVVAEMSAGLAPGLYGFFALSAIAAVASLTLLRVRALPTP